LPKRNHTFWCGFFLLSLMLRIMIFDHQSVSIPTERSEGGSQTNAPLPVAGGGALVCVQRSAKSRKSVSPKILPGTANGS